MLEIRELVKHYSAGGGEVVRALDRVSLTIEAGELVALYGPSGSQACRPSMCTAAAS